MYRHAAAFVIALAFASTAQAPPAQTPPAQAPPATEVFLANLAVGSDGAITTDGAAVNISNSPGYDNQPGFLGDGSVLFASNRDGKQTDIYRYHIASTTLTQLTHTPESEYSPKATPDGKGFSVVRVEADSTQRLWRFDLDGANPRLVLENVKPVGYYVWGGVSRLALFVLGADGQPNTLQLADTTTGKSEVIASNIGRCLQFRVTGRLGAVTFVSKQTTPWMIREYDVATQTTADVRPVIAGSEDFVWETWSQGRLLMASGSKLFVAKGAEEWREAGDFSGAGIGRIVRLALRPGNTPASIQSRLALVGEPIAR